MPTVSAAVPTVWADLFRYGNDHDLDLSSLRFVACGGGAAIWIQAGILEVNGTISAEENVVLPLRLGRRDSDLEEELRLHLAMAAEEARRAAEAGVTLAARDAGRFARAARGPPVCQ